MKFNLEKKLHHKMSNLREIHKWIDEYNDKQLTPPPVASRVIEIIFDGEVNGTLFFFFLYTFLFQVQL